MHSKMAAMQKAKPEPAKSPLDNLKTSTEESPQPISKPQGGGGYYLPEDEIAVSLPKESPQ